MRGLIIFFLFLLLIFAVGMIKLSFIIRYKNEFSAKLKFYFINIQLSPKKDKKVKIKNYTPKKIRKREAKEARKKAKRLQKLRGKEEKKEKKKLIKSFSDVVDLVRLIKEVAELFFSKFFHYLKTEINALKIKIGGDEADKIAIKYGIVIQTVAYTLELLDTFSNLKIKHYDSIDIQPCYTEKNFNAEIDIVLSIRVWQVIACVFISAYKFITSKNNNIFKIKLLSKESGGQKDGRE